NAAQHFYVEMTAVRRHKPAVMGSIIGQSTCCGLGSTMEFNGKHDALATIKTGWLAVGISEAKTLTGPAAELDATSGGQIRAAIKRGDITGKSGQSLMLFALPGISAQRVLLVGTGKDELNDRSFRKLVAGVIGGLRSEE